MTFSGFVALNVCLQTAKEPKDADIIWTSVQVDEDMKKVIGITDHQYINQFPFEACLVMKHHLAETIQKVILFISLHYNSCYCNLSKLLNYIYYQFLARHI